MKNRIKRKYRAINELLENPEDGQRSIAEKIDLSVEDHQDYLLRIAALIEVCVLAMDGQGSLYSEKCSHSDKVGSVTMVLEMVLELLPFDQMTCLDRITELVQDKCQSSTSSTSDI